LKVVIPRKQIVDNYDKTVIPLLKLIRKLLKQNQLLKEARDILLPRLMTGMIDVDNLDIPEAINNTASV
ncbi:MAG: hypothetical protein GQ569_09350, partial [Methylococcaceae bacterium]|nr:hypothetical protein [Methylococcaceae bacterium]